MSSPGRTIAVIQARMSSTRLPGKVLLDLDGSPVVDHVVRRVGRARLVDEVWVATSTAPDDDILTDNLSSLGTPVVRGSLDDVLSRYALSSERSNADVVVRITADCPLIDPAVIDGVIRSYREAPSVDYCSNTLVRTYPIGMDTEVFSRAALDRAALEATTQQEREHVTPYIYQHPESFRLRNVEAPPDSRRPGYRLAIDEAADLQVVVEVLARVGGNAALEEICALLDEDPELAEANRAVEHRHVWRPEVW